MALLSTMSGLGSFCQTLIFAYLTKKVNYYKIQNSIIKKLLFHLKTLSSLYLCF